MPRKKPEVYPSDLSDEQWELVSPALRAAVGRSGRISRRSILNAIFYVHLCSSHRLSMALFAAELSALEDGLLVFLALAAKWRVGCRAGRFAGGSAL